MRVIAVAVACVVAAACAKKKSIDAERAAGAFERVTIDTGGIHGLSGLAIAADGAVWTVAERGKTAYRVELDGTKVRKVDRVGIEGLPAGNDLESAAFGPDGDLFVGTENNAAGIANVFRLHRDGGVLRVTGEPITLTKADAGVDVGANHGAEAACAAGGRLAVALETAGSDARGRWAPLVVVDLATGAKVGHRVRLRTSTGKLSGLDCWTEPGTGGARIRAVAIERHFEVTQLVGFDLPAAGAPTTDIATELVLDLAPALRGALNLEGIVRFPDGRLVAVVDNQYKTITGPDELLCFKTPLPASPPPP
ncbi:MAG TPA: esterase-like activity of phytase family protein [Kofleriaceae bacterium]|nr:esterase-like activity of phytase family protein [Kofleriaceae bacterium]